MEELLNMGAEEDTDPPATEPAADVTDGSDGLAESARLEKVRDHVEATILGARRLITVRVREGVSAPDIASELNEGGFSPPGKGNWTAAAVAEIWLREAGG